jgi:hypothetical protein
MRARAFLLFTLFASLPVALAGGASGQKPKRERSTSGAAKLVLTRHVEHLDAPAREPMIVEHPSGALFVSGYRSGRPTLWKSLDRGAKWARVNVGTEAQGAVGNSDVDLAIARDGTLYFVAMGYNRRVNEGTSIAIGVSRNLGATWSWTILSKTRFDDRPWVEVAPDGTAHVIWNDGRGVNHVVIRDRGVSWTKQPRINDHGGSSHLAVGPNGEVAVRIVPLSASGNKFDSGVDLIAVSTNGGASWQKHSAPGQRDWKPLTNTEPGRIPRWVEPLAWDAQGFLYSLWTDHTGVWLARSTDQGANWKQWRLVETSDLAHYPYLIARDRGELAATWFTGSAETLRWHAARIDLSGNDSQPRVMESLPLRADSWDPPDRPGDPPVRDTAGEYLGITFLRNGGLAVVSPIQDPMRWRYGFSWWRFDVH